MKTDVFTQGLHEGDLLCSLVKKPPHDYDEPLVRLAKYINMEEAQKARLEQKGSQLIEAPERKGEAQISPQFPIPIYQPYNTLLRISKERALQYVTNTSF